MRLIRHPLTLTFTFWVACVLGCVAPGNRNYSSNNSSAPSSTTPRLELLSQHGIREYGYLTVDGEVKNISGEKMEHVQAVVACYTSDGSLVTSQDAIITYDPIMPGQTSPFKVMATDNPAIKTYRVSFKEFWGGEIDYIDSAHHDSSNKKSGKGKK